MTEEKPPQAVHRYRLFVNQMGIVDLQSPMDWDGFVASVRLNAYVLTPSGFFPLHAISAIVRADEVVPVLHHVQAAGSA